MHLDTYIILSKKLFFICTRFRNRSKREPMARFSCLFCSKCKKILLWQCMYIMFILQCPKVSKFYWKEQKLALFQLFSRVSCQHWLLSYSLLYMNQVIGELYTSSSCKDKVDMCPFIDTVNVNKWLQDKYSLIIEDLTFIIRCRTAKIKLCPFSN